MRNLSEHHFQRHVQMDEQGPRASIIQKKLRALNLGRTDPGGDFLKCFSLRERFF